ncbi:MAG: hypothetical protein HKN23_02360 [Verrucomicrobiales bacterium]|nr:hypothetical protein [Verrucomicrobiales bacterium]
MKPARCFLPVALICLIPVAGISQNEDRSPIYPFDVKIGGGIAKLDGSIRSAIFARAAKPVKNDAVIEVVGTDPATIFVNVFPCNGKGEITRAAQAEAKVIMAPNATKFQLDQTMDKTKLGPGTYLMNIVIQAKGTSRVLFEVGDGKAVTAAPAGKEGPEAVLQQVFDAAKSGKLADLKPLQSRTADGDVKRVCGVSEAPADAQADFQKYFREGKVTGKARISGDKAEVDFRFGPGATKKETMNLVKEGDAWLLDSF